MKYIILIILVLSTEAFAQESDPTTDLTQVLQNARCIPRRDSSTGEITGTECEDRSVKSGNQERFQQIGVKRMEVLKIQDGETLETTNLEPMDSEQKAMEQYNTTKTTGATQLGTQRQ
ncbi:MAG: hypothetical protein H7256_01675 [Bdellovibrio sp.]|nr:hypothetical protein [Bdellovibrio sp.]